MAETERMPELARAKDRCSLLVLLALSALLLSLPTVHCGEYLTINTPTSVSVVSCEGANLGLEPTSCSSVVKGILIVNIMESGKFNRKYDVFSVSNHDDESMELLSVTWTGNLSLVVDRVDVNPTSTKAGHSGTVSLFTKKDAGVGAYAGDILLSFGDNQGSEIVEVLVPVNMVLTS